MVTQAPRLGQRACPVLEGTPKHCRATVRPRYLMCGRHWAHVPKDVQNEVWRTWRAWQRTSSDDRWDAYMTARAAALAHFTDQDAEDRGTPSRSGLTWDDLDAAALVLVVAPDGHSRMWYGGDREAAAKVLHTVYGDLTTGPVIDGRPT